MFLFTSIALALLYTTDSIAGALPARPRHPSNNAQEVINQNEGPAMLSEYHGQHSLPDHDSNSIGRVEEIFPTTHGRSSKLPVTVRTRFILVQKCQCQINR